MVYLNVISVNTTLSNRLDVDGVGDGSAVPVVGISPAIEVDGVGDGADLPVVGISPAKIEVERAHISATAIANRFMSFQLLQALGENDAKVFT